MKNLLFFVCLTIWLISCSGRGTADKEREDSIRTADSIAAVQAAEEAAEQARLDSIKEAKSIKPYALIQRASSVTYEFLLPNEISSNLKKLGFKAGKTKETGWMDHPNCMELRKSTTLFTRIENDESTQVSVTTYDVDWGGIGTDEEYIVITFGNEKEKENFIEKVLKLKFVNKTDSKITIGEGEKYMNIYVDYSKPLKVEIYGDNTIQFMNV